MQPPSTMRQEYVNVFPSNVPLKMVQGAILSSALGYIFHKGSGEILLGASASALCTLVEAAVRPIFTKIFANDEYVAIAISALTAYAVTTAAAAVIAPWLHATTKIGDLFYFALAFAAPLISYNNQKNDAFLFVF